MSKLKTGIAAVLTLALLVGGAFFPKLVSAVQDQISRDNATSNPIRSIQLEIEKNVSVLGRMVMLVNVQGAIELTENKTKMTSQEVMDAARKGLQPYIDVNLIKYNEAEVTLSPHLLQVPDMLELQGIVWSVAITIAADPYSYINLIIDDETGHILQIWYASEDNPCDIPAEDALVLLAEIFFSSLDLDYAAQGIAVESIYANDALNAANRYCFTDPKYGEVLVDLYVYPEGFYIEYACP